MTVAQRRHPRPGSLRRRAAARRRSTRRAATTISTTASVSAYALIESRRIPGVWHPPRRRSSRCSTRVASVLSRLQDRAHRATERRRPSCRAAPYFGVSTGRSMIFPLEGLERSLPGFVEDALDLLGAPDAPRRALALRRSDRPWTPWDDRGRMSRRCQPDSGSEHTRQAGPCYRPPRRLDRLCGTRFAGAWRAWCATSPCESSSRGYAVLAAASADEAMRASETHPGRIHLLLTDVIMPGAGGEELARTLAAKRPDMKIPPCRDTSTARSVTASGSSRNRSRARRSPGRSETRSTPMSDAVRRSSG